MSLGVARMSVPDIPFVDHRAPAEIKEWAILPAQDSVGPVNVGSVNTDAVHSGVASTDLAGTDLVGTDIVKTDAFSRTSR